MDLPIESETICTHCKMYTKPFIHEEEGRGACEFCGKDMLRKIDGKWERIILPD
jgi:hypothetical protein